MSEVSIMRAREKIASAMRVALALEPWSPDLVSQVSRQVAITPASYKILFPSAVDLLDQIHALLVRESASRLQSAVENFAQPIDGDPLRAAALTIARSKPMDRVSVMIRLERRVQALRSGASGSATVSAEREFQRTQQNTLELLMEKLEREFTGDPRLAVRVVMDTFERSIESWLLRGGRESDFERSHYIQSALPSLLAELSRCRIASDA